MKAKMNEKEKTVKKYPILKSYMSLSRGWMKNLEKGLLEA
jgi:hypothetical protein